MSVCAIGSFGFGKSALSPSLPRLGMGERNYTCTTTIAPGPHGDRDDKREGRRLLLWVE